jgi:cell division protein FtsW
VNLRLLIPFFDPTVREWSTLARILRWLTFLWLLMGLLILFSASYYHGKDEARDGFHYFFRQLFATAIAMVIFNLIVHSPLRKMLNVSQWFLLIILGLISLTLVKGIGKEVLGATRWISVGPIQLQPTELIKPFLVLQGAKLFGNWEKYSIKFRAIWLVIFGVILLTILKQPNLSTTALCGISLWMIAFAAGLPLRYMLGTALGGLVVGTISILLNPYQLERFSFLNPWADSQDSGFQLVQSLQSIGSGGLWGRGFGLSQQKLGYLPIQDTDFIFSVFAEEFGFIGCLLLLLGIVFFAALGTIVAMRCRHPVHRLIAMGSTIFIVLQSLLNIGVATGVLPTTGLPLPMFSYGGTSMIGSLAHAALLIRVARESASESKVIPLTRNL